MNKILFSHKFRKDHYIEMRVNTSNKYIITIFYKGTNKIKENRSPESRIYDYYNNAKSRYDLLYIIEKNNFNLEEKIKMDNLINDLQKF
jgi:hypothetical protein